MPQVEEDLGSNIDLCLSYKLISLKSLNISEVTLFINTNKNNSLKKKRIIFNLESSFIKKNKITKKDLKSQNFYVSFLTDNSFKKLKWSTSKSKILLKTLNNKNLKTDSFF